MTILHGYGVGVHLSFAPNLTPAALPVQPQIQHKQLPWSVGVPLLTESSLAEGKSSVVCQALVPFSPCMSTMIC